jgi:predicted CoA-binding protein
LNIADHRSLSVDHDAYRDDYIRGILTSVKTIAVVGASSNEARPSYFLLKYLLGKRYKAIPVNPGLAGKSILGQTVYARLADIPVPVDMVEVFRRSDAIPGILDEVLAMKPVPKVLWLQLGIRDDESARRAEAAGLKVVMDRCAKIEYGRLCGEIGWMGVNSRTLSSKKPTLSDGFQHLDIAPKK